MIFTFYSYKGGVGRTHLLANIAAYLCYYKKRKVLLIDWDLEAPGLHFYFDKKDEDLQHTKGLIDLCENYQLQISKATEENPLQEKDLLFPNQDYIYNLITAQNGGKIDILPAIQYTENYHQRINQFDWLDFHDNQKGSIYLSWLKSKLKLKSNYDYVFIDSRTGQNDYSGICNVLMPDMNILVVAPNTQNFEGAKKMADRILRSKYVEELTDMEKPDTPPRFILPILSRYDDYVSENAKKYRNKFINYFYMYFLPISIKESSSKNTDAHISIQKLPFELITIKTSQKYNPLIAVGENILFSEKQERIIEGDFLNNIINITKYFLEPFNKNQTIDLVNLIGDSLVDVWNDIVKKTDSNTEEKKIACLELANYHAKRGNYQKALENYKIAIDLFKDNKYKLYILYYEIGQLHFEKRKFEEAKTNYEECNIYLEKIEKRHTILRKIQQDYKKYTLCNIGKCYRELGKYAESIKYIQDSIDLTKNYVYGYYSLGKTHQYFKEYKKAKECYEYVLELNPRYIPAWNNLGVIYNSQQNDTKAIECYESALQIDENHADVWNNLGVVYAKQQNYAEAIKSFERALKIDENDASAWNNLSCTYSLEKNKEQALFHLKKAIEIDTEYKQQAQTDTDFEWLWQDKDFLTLVKNDLL
ncbi:MAG: tetratricopeptide repeat protein [Bacteroidetes bacterium]|nr:MAG: tetratricopeptide repeat protein [Bacteroidota bacterium]